LALQQMQGARWATPRAGDQLVGVASVGLGDVSGIVAVGEVVAPPPVSGTAAKKMPSPTTATTNTIITMVNQDGRRDLRGLSWFTGSLRTTADGLRAPGLLALDDLDFATMILPAKHC